MPRRTSGRMPRCQASAKLTWASDLTQAKALFPAARRAVMCTPMDAANKTLPKIETDFERMARDYAPCDVVIADLEAGMPDSRIIELVELCKKFSLPNRPLRSGV